MIKINLIQPVFTTNYLNYATIFRTLFDKHEHNNTSMFCWNNNIFLICTLQR